MPTDPYLDTFIQQCAQQYTDAEPPAGEKLASEAIVSLITVLVYEGLKVMLPEIKEWLKLGATKIALKRLEIRKKLVAYAKKKQLEFPEAEKAAELVAAQLDEKTLGNVVNAFKTVSKS